MVRNSEKKEQFMKHSELLATHVHKYPRWEALVSPHERYSPFIKEHPVSLLNDLQVRKSKPCWKKLIVVFPLAMHNPKPLSFHQCLNDSKVKNVQSISLYSVRPSVTRVTAGSRDRGCHRQVPFRTTHEKG